MYFCENGRFIVLLLFSLMVVTVLGEQCKVVPKCTCRIGGEQVEVTEQKTSNEALAGAVGALGSLMVTGGGVGVWYLVKGRKSDTGPDFERSNSRLDDEDVDRGKKGKGPPPYRNGADSEMETAFTRTPNIYRAGRNDMLSHKVGAAPRGVLDDF